MAEVEKARRRLACQRCGYEASSVSAVRLLEYFVGHEAHVHGVNGVRPAHKRREVVHEPQAWARFKVGDRYTLPAPMTFKPRTGLSLPTEAERLAEMTRAFYDGTVIGVAEHVMLVELDIPEEVTV